jgi:hypothetical protein
VTAHYSSLHISQGKNHGMSKCALHCSGCYQGARDLGTHLLLASSGLAAGLVRIELPYMSTRHVYINVGPCWVPMPLPGSKRKPEIFSRA